MTRLSGSFRIGTLTIHQLSDGAERARRASWFNGIDPSIWAPVVGVSGADALFPVNYGGFVITGDGHVTLIDTGFGSPARTRRELEGGGQMIERLSEIGVGRNDVDLVVQTHLHSDHCGWLVCDDGVTLGFPNATVHVHESEVAYWMSGASDNNGMSPFVRSRLAPVRAAGRLSTFDGEFAVSAAVTAVPTPGHTPGHSSVLVASNGAYALLLGDVAHHPVHLEHHDWLPRIDLDPSDSILSRAKMAALAAERDALVTAPHMPILTLGRVRRVGDGYRYLPERRPSDEEQEPSRVG
jgi:glyoxylase-like metal-dependent hydrolase (beta-lactamase superfamily II)